MIKVGIIGCGKIADQHASSIQRISDCEIVGVCDSEELMAKQMYERFNVKHYYTKPYRPQTNGKIERFWKILSHECILCQRTTLTKNELISELNNFMYRYNYQRRHGGLNYETPLDKLKFIADLLPKL